MIDEMGIFRTEIEVASLTHPDRRRRLANVMVDNDSWHSWIPRAVLEGLGIQAERVERYKTADGRIVEREIGFALVYAANRRTVTPVAFAEPGDKTLLGALGLDGLNVRVDMIRRELVPAGPVSAAA